LAERSVAIGTVRGSFGTKGDLRVNPLVSDEVFYSLKRCFSDGITYEVISVRPHKNWWLLKIAGFSAPEDMNGLLGKTLYINGSELPKPAEDEVYWADIEGFDVLDDAGRHVGRLTDYMQTGSCDVFVIEDASGAELLVSNNPDHVLSIDVEAKRITVARIGISS
jgi:16S rRNA processing protein RimM